MSSLAFRGDGVLGPARARNGAAWITDHGYEIALAMPLAILAAVLLIRLPQAFNVDSWLALATGRLVWQTGLPHHETLTVLTHGVTWIDQQWLSQLASYGLYRVGGLGLLGLVNVAMLAGAVTFAVFAARRRGGSFAATLVALPLCLVMIARSGEVRTQTFAVPLFMAVIYLLGQDARRPSPQVFWCLPLLVVWANLHGTVTLGAGLVALHGLVMLFGRRGELVGNLRAWARPGALIAGSAAAILVTPYGLSTVGYYGSTMVSGTLRHAVSEWQPITTVPLTAIAVVAVVGLALSSFRRWPGRTTTWEKLAVALLAASAVSVVRNALFFGLFALLLLPTALAWGKPGATTAANPGPRILANGTAALVAVAVLGVGVAVTLARPASQYESARQSPGMLAAVARVTGANPSLRVMTDWRFADWLLWRDPALGGRMAYDVRYELLGAKQLGGIESLLSQSTPAWKQAARGYRMIVLNRTYDPGALAAFRAEPGAKMLYNSATGTVILRRATEAAR